MDYLLDEDAEHLEKNIAVDAISNGAAALTMNSTVNFVLTTEKLWKNGIKEIWQKLKELDRREIELRKLR